jgi:alpha-L-arabinofuranosidase
VEIGNEDWLAGRPAGWESYKQYRFKAFLDAINKKYPEMKVLASGSVYKNMTIPAPAGGDHHDYLMPDEFVKNFNFFDQLTAQNQTLLGMLITLCNGYESYL